MRESLDAAIVRRWCAAALVALRRHQREIDRLNVFPVPDADTGTNLVLTFQAAGDALAAEAPNEGETGRDAFERLARGALLGARGNSGVIVSQLLAAAAGALPATAPARGRGWAEALRVAVVAGYSAVADPVEGTVLTVAAAAATAAADVDSDDLPTVTAATVRAAALALEHTPAQLAALGLPEVMDAGGRGLLVVLDALDAVVRDESDRVLAATPEVGPTPPESAHAGAGAGATRDRPGAIGWEVQYLLDVGPGTGTEDLRRGLAAVGDSVVVASAGPHERGATWTVHVHTADIGAALEAGLDLGRPHRVVVTPLISSAQLDTQAQFAQPSATGRGVVAVVPGTGLANLFAAAGAVTVAAAPDAAPTVAALRAAVRRTGAAEVVLLANGAAHTSIADEAGRDVPGATVTVLHTRSPVQGIAALAVADPGRPFRDDVVAMAEAAAATRWAELLIADRDALTVAGPCRAGDVLALVDGDVVAVGTQVLSSATGLLDRLLNAGGELVTLVTGAGAGPDLGEALRAHLRSRWPFCECQLLDGGQRHAVLLIGVE